MTRLVALLSAAACAQQFDVLVYGGTAGGVIAAVAAAREGLSCAIVEPGRNLGGMTSGGLGRTDHGRKETIGGYSLEFYKRLGKRYGEEITWYFEPHAAEDVLREMATEARVTIFYEQRLREETGVRKRGNRIVEIFTERGAAFQAKIFVDASYEGDLMAQARVGYTIGREASTRYGESLAGVRPKDRNHMFEFPVSGVGSDGRPLAGVQGEPRGALGTADAKVQAYNFRMCLSSDERNQVPFPKPKNYDPARHELLARYLDAWVQYRGAAPRMNDLFIVSPLPNRKTDINNRGAYSTDVIGASWAYPDGNYQTRAVIWQDHMDYTAGLFFFLANDDRVPESLRKEVGSYGLAADEFIGTHHWPHQLYIREARRMTGDFVMTQRDIQIHLSKPDSIGMGSYNSDSHNVQRHLVEGGLVQNEGNMEVAVRPYQIPYRVLVPRKNEAANLLVPVCVSASHVAYSTLRMEPVYMIMGQAAGVAARLAIEKGVAVQEISTQDLMTRLRAQAAVLEIR